MSSPSKRTRWLRGWMLVAPVDAAALAAPMLLTLQYWRGTLTMVVVTIAFFALGGLYRARRYVSILDELPTICGRLLASSAVVAIIAAMRHDSVGYVEGFMRSVALSAGLVIVGRTLTRTAIIVARRRRWVEHNAIIIGSGPIALELARLLRRHPQYGLRFAGCIDTVPVEGALVKPAVAALLGGLDSLDRSIELVDCDVLIVADSASPDDAVLAVLGTPAGISRDVWIVPRLWGAGLEGDVPDHIGAIPLLHMRHNAFGGPRWAVKRGSDIALSATALILLSPILLLCAIAVWLEGRGRSGIFFKQERVGHYGRPFNVIKFRSMMPRDENDSQTTWSIAGDSRVGPIGRFLRRTSADELPQLWNILRGDMTIVGPRPERPYFVDRFSAEHPEYAMRHRVPVGLTGLAQVNGLRGDTPISDRARFDNFYIQHWSLWLDVKVILRTISEVLRGGGR
ncbi:sugar transferase [Actinoplanes subglobosus]|uniref:Sugar transferase n=1 Tax=Actinoplanes subglobosus TaxID=1547892 RepID=A0ABV8IM40_9ACTN